MTHIHIEHVNLTVSDPQATAAMLMALFDWKIRWEGPHSLGGYTVHVGSDSQYISVYANADSDGKPREYRKGQPLNHVGIVTDDLAEIERRVTAQGLKPFGHDDYEPGKRFYFFDRDGVEYEIVSYG